MLVTKLIAVLKAERLADRRHALRIERQHACSRCSSIERDEAGKAEEQHGDRVDDPVLLLASRRRRTARRSAAFDRPQDGRQERPLAAEDARHVAAERLCDDHNSQQ